MFIQRLKNFYHLLVAIGANLFYGFPSRKLFVIGVTGTNGKTITVQMINRILEKVGYKTGMVSTINFQIGKRKWANKTKFTTVNSLAHQRFLAQCVKAKCKFVVIETSSHALDQNRVWGTDYDIGVITNVTREHLDYHQTMEEYRLAKLKLFKYLAGKKNSLKEGREMGFSVVNLLMKRPEEFISENPEKSYGYLASEQQTKLIKNPKHLLQARDIILGQNGSWFKVAVEEYELKLPGLFNIENALAAICVGKILSIDNKIIKKALVSIERVPGRMDRVLNDKGIEIIIDYALTPDSMEKVGQLLRGRPRESSGNHARLYWVFGSCGQRDRGKRPIMGKIAAKYADVVIVTNEDPYREDPRQIIDEVFKGVMDEGKIEGKNVFRIMDRREAIKTALELAQRGDVILITGKGAEENMKIGNKLIEWNDREVVEELLEEVEIN